MLLKLLLTSLFAGSLACVSGCVTAEVPNIRACKTNPLNDSKRCAYFIEGESFDLSWEDWYLTEDAEGLTEDLKSISIRDQDYLEIKLFIEKACSQLGKQCQWPLVEEKLKALEASIGE